MMLSNDGRISRATVTWKVRERLRRTLWCKAVFTQLHSVILQDRSHSDKGPEKKKKDGKDAADSSQEDGVLQAS